MVALPVRESHGASCISTNRPIVSVAPVVRKQEDASETQKTTQKQATEVPCLRSRSIICACQTRWIHLRRSSHPAMDGVGFLFMINGGHLNVTDGDTVTLGGGRKWQARYSAEGLQLTIVHVENNSHQQVCDRQAGIKNELDHRKQEVLALRAQTSELQTKMEQVLARAHAHMLYPESDDWLCGMCQCRMRMMVTTKHLAKT